MPTLLRSPKLLLVAAGAADIGATLIGFMTSERFPLVFVVVAVTLTLALVIGTLVDGVAFLYAFMGWMLFGVLSQLLPTPDFDRVPVAVADLVGLGLAFAYLRLRKQDSHREL